MRRALLAFMLLAILVGLAGCASSSAQRAPTRIRVLTYNIHHGEGTDQKFDYERLARVIQAANPDLVALQEVDQGTRRASGLDQPAELERRTGLHAVFGKTMDYAGGCYGNAILSRWSILEVTSHPLPSSAGHEPRAAIAIKVRASQSEPPIVFVSTHLDHTRDESERRNQAAHLNRLFIKEDGIPVILAGDLNAIPESQPMQTLWPHWQDSAQSNPQPTIPSANPRSRIDYILFRPSHAGRVLEVRVIEESVASDHRPLLAVIEFSNLPPKDGVPLAKP